MKKRRLRLGIMALPALVLAWTGAACKAKPSFSGTLLLLSQSAVLAVSQESVETVLSGVQAAALSPDGRRLLFALAGQVVIRDIQAGSDKTVLASSARSLGWAPDGSKFFIVSGCDSNRLLVGDLAGKTTEIFRGRKAKPAETGDAAEAAESPCSEIGGCLFLDQNLLLFSAFESARAHSSPEERLVANRGYLVRLDADPLEFSAVDFPAGERWSFQDLSSEGGLVLVSVDKNPGSADAFRSTVHAPKAFRDWGELAFGAEVVPSVARWLSWSWDYDGEAALVFTPVSHRLFGLVYEVTESGTKGDFLLYDPASGDGSLGPPMEPGRLVNRPVFSPDERIAAVLHDDGGATEKVLLLDLTAKKAATAWKVEAAPDARLDVRRDRLLGWLD
jgi:hypothetical protein